MDSTINDKMSRQEHWQQSQEQNHCANKITTPYNTAHNRAYNANTGLSDVSSFYAGKKNCSNPSQLTAGPMQFYTGLKTAPTDSQQCDVACKILGLFQDNGPFWVCCCLGKWSGQF